MHACSVGSSHLPTRQLCRQWPYASMATWRVLSPSHQLCDLCSRALTLGLPLQLCNRMFTASWSAHLPRVDQDTFPVRTHICNQRARSGHAVRCHAPSPATERLVHQLHGRPRTQLQTGTQPLPSQSWLLPLALTGMARISRSMAARWSSSSVKLALIERICCAIVCTLLSACFSWRCDSPSSTRSAFT